MKGLADGAPHLQRVKIESRSARKHYGANSDLRFVEGVHKKDKRYWDSFSGCYRVPAMWWYLKKGDTVKEHEPTKFPYFRAQQVSDGPPQTIKITIQACSDPQNQGAPVYQDASKSNPYHLYSSFPLPVGTGMWLTIVALDQPLLTWSC